MSCRQFCNSVQSILGNPHIHRGRGLARHLHWQIRKALNLFPYEQTISRSRIIAHHGRCGVSALINSQGLYDYNNMRLVQRLLRDGGVFFDIGANIGSYSLVASEQTAALVYAFEPHPVTFRMLQENIDLNRRKNVRLFNLALGGSDDEVFLTDEGGSAMNHLTAARAAGTIPVPCMRGDTFCAEQEVVPTCVKIDVEGFEYDVLSGFGPRLRSADFLLIELNGLSDERSRGAAAIQGFLTDHGFRGPWRCDFDARILSPDRHVNTKDSLYVSDASAPALEAMGFRFKDLR